MRIRVPATSANLGPGFDTLGMALQFYNHFEASPADQLRVTLSPSTCADVDNLSLDPDENLLAKAYSAYYRFRQTELIPAELMIEAHIPLSRGMGSSSTAIVAGLVLADLMHPQPLGRDALVPRAVELEGHPDNVVPALLGGVRCCVSDAQSICYSWPEPWGILLVIPPNPLSTHEARAIMPPHYSQGQVIQNIRGISAWVHAIQTQDAALFRYALTTDTIHEPSRGKLIPEYPIIQSLLKDTNALGVVISGSGSTLAVFTPDLKTQQELRSLLSQSEPLSHCRVIPVKPDHKGTKILPSPLGEEPL